MFNLLIKYRSLSFLYDSLLYLTCSNIVTLRLDTMCPGEVKWGPVALIDNITPVFGQAVPKGTLAFPYVPLFAIIFVTFYQVY